MWEYFVYVYFCMVPFLYFSTGCFKLHLFHYPQGVFASNNIDPHCAMHLQENQSGGYLNLSSLDITHNCMIFYQKELSITEISLFDLQCYHHFLMGRLIHSMRVYDEQRGDLELLRWFQMTQNWCYRCHGGIQRQFTRAPWFCQRSERVWMSE